MTTTLDASIQLDLENALKAFLVATVDGLVAHSAHALETPASPDYLSIIAGLADWETMSGEGAIVPVTFQLCTGVADPDPRTAKTLAHQSKLGSIIECFTQQNCVATKAALDAVNPGLGFIGWGPLPHQDGQSADSKQLAPQLNYVFEVYLRAL